MAVISISLQEPITRGKPSFEPPGEGGCAREESRAISVSIRPTLPYRLQPCVRRADSWPKRILMLRLRGQTQTFARGAKQAQTLISSYRPRTGTPDPHPLPASDR